MYLAVALLGAAAVTINLLVHLASPYREAGPEYIAAFLAIGLLVVAARRASGEAWRRIPVSGAALSLRQYFFVGFAFIGGSFLLYAGGPALGGLPILSLAEGLALLAVTLLLVRRASGRPDVESLMFAFVAGVVGFFCVFDLVLAPRNSLMLIPSVAFGYLLLRLWRGRPRQLAIELAARA